MSGLIIDSFAGGGGASTGKLKGKRHDGVERANMKDNLQNYLYPHSIDPSRIDHAPGNDSIRANCGSQPTMSNAEVISILERIEADIYGRIAIGKAIDALREETK